MSSPRVLTLLTVSVLTVGSGRASFAGAGAEPSEEASTSADLVSQHEPEEDPAVAVLADLPTCARSSEIAFDPDRRENPDNFTLPEPSVTEAIPASLAALHAGEVGAARRAARAAGYDLCRDPDDLDVALWHPITEDAAYARFAWRFRGARPVIVEAPHPNFDLDTDAQARLLFERLAARALLMAGAHRCTASEAHAGCSGTTGVCGEDDSPYPVSDVAHSPDTIFHAAHVFFADTFAEDWVVSLHGFTEAGISVSDGTPVALPENAAAAKVGASLQAAFPEEEITSCNPYPGAVFEPRRCGTTNVQGRHVNGALDACGAPATQSAGRFVHLEQSLEVRQQHADRVVEAIADAIDAP